MSSSKLPSSHVSRRQFLTSATAAAIGLPIVLGPAYKFVAGQATFTPPDSPRRKLNFNLNWKFLRDDASGAEAPGFSDAKWSTVSTPHSFNDVDSFRGLISHGGGDRGTYKGLSWYRKHFKLPASLAGQKLFLEFEGMRQAGDIYLNGKSVGLYENGVTAYGIDITRCSEVRRRRRTSSPSRLTTAPATRNAWARVMKGAPRTSGTPTTSTPITAASTGMYGCISSWARSTRRCRSSTASRASRRLHSRRRLRLSPKRPQPSTVDSEVRNGSSDRATVELYSAIVVDRDRQASMRTVHRRRGRHG